MAWNTNGNTGTNSTTDFLGTTDAQPLLIRTNSKEAVHIDSTGRVGVGTATPQNLLHVGPGASSIAATRVNAVIASTVPDAGISIAQNSGVNLLVQASTAGGYIGTTSNHNLVLRTLDLDRFFIDINGDATLFGTLSVGKDVILTGADCAEQFDIVDDSLCDPGTVMSISSHGALDASSKEYDRKVAGVISGAGNYRPAIVLDKRGSDDRRPAVALFGKVYCKVDARHAAVEIGDLLTTSNTPGHAMKAGDQARAFGAVLGKALGALPDGCGLVPILISLQ